jgi:hypothetical protein
MVVVAEVVLVMVATPLCTVHVPLPTAGTTAAIVKVLVLHWVTLAGPASATLDGKLLVSTTSSKVLAQTPLLIVHRTTVGGPPAVTPVTVLVSKLAVVTLPGPLWMVHVPVPGDATLPANVKVLVLHMVWSTFALATGAAAVLVNTISSKVLAHTPLPTVHRRVALVPGAIPVMVVVADVVLVMVAVPL